MVNKKEVNPKTNPKIFIRLICLYFNKLLTADRKIILITQFDLWLESNKITHALKRQPGYLWPL